MGRKTFSESFSKWVRNGSSMQWQSTLHSFGKSRNFDPKNGHEPPDSDLRLNDLRKVRDFLALVENRPPPSPNTTSERRVRFPSPAPLIINDLRGSAVKVQ